MTHFLKASFHKILMSCTSPVMHSSCPAPHLSCIPHVLHLTCRTSLMSCTSTVVHSSCPVPQLSCIPNVLHLNCRASLMSCTSPVVHPSCPAPHLSCIPRVLHKCNLQNFNDQRQRIYVQYMYISIKKTKQPPCIFYSRYIYSIESRKL